MKKSVIGIIMGSSSDGKIMKSAAETLDAFGVGHEDQIVSAHRTPQRLQEYARHAEESGLKAIIAGAGGAAHLPGMIASFTTIPVIGVPIIAYNVRDHKSKAAFSALGGIDALLSISEMPNGSPVATVGINKAANAALYALKILGNESDHIKKRLVRYKNIRNKEVLRESAEMKKRGLVRFSTKKST